MAGSVNKAILIGNLGRDPEIRTAGSGDRCANLRIATSESWTDKASGERKEATEWHSVVIWNEALVRVAEAYLRKGRKVYVEGALKTRKWTDQNGVERYSTEVVIGRFGGALQILDRADPAQAGGASPAASSPASSGGYADSSGGFRTGHPDRSATTSQKALPDDEVPF